MLIYLHYLEPTVKMVDVDIRMCHFKTPNGYFFIYQNCFLFVQASRCQRGSDRIARTGQFRIGKASNFRSLAQRPEAVPIAHQNYQV